MKDDKKEHSQQVIESHRYDFGKDAEAFWDTRAEQFYRSTQKSGKNQIESLMKFLLERNLLQESSSLLDVGCGTGRHALAYAKKVRAVVGTDISAGMLDYAQKSSREEDIKNLQFVKLDWQQADLKLLQWTKRFDFVFSSMCPAIESKESLLKMSEASKGYCLINRFVQRKDEVGDRLREHLQVDAHNDPHNKREKALAIFNELWSLGYYPEITYLDAQEELFFTAKEAVAHYTMRLGTITAAQQEEMENFFQKEAEKGMIHLRPSSKAAWILWKAD
ncbi:class I SAM-dependent methyltransferase [Heliorestis convoluta]|uniref:Class I SAM-dependent methyltransferase n=1 Tax=Heliorestis convoluta TaxID=356322 RepID=A0A5Q2N5Z9_9FIRM|nr:class I SAM-dependent methyltransferase [Heliorestis convoluta]QGG49056.1 class I SAM-dependent methyltransferase [Heliorestis convoluta]